MIALAIQFGAHPAHVGSGDLLDPLLLVVGLGVVGGLLLVLARVAVQQARALRRRRRRARVALATGAEARARALMSELCPHGWRAQITLYAGEDLTVPGDPVRAPVALDWYELRPGGGEPAVMRRVWADSVVAALEAMVADRRTDETLEQIELRASADGAAWPDF